MAAKKILMVCGDYCEDYETMVPLQALLTVAPRTRPGLDNCWRCWAAKSSCDACMIARNVVTRQSVCGIGPDTAGSQ